MTDFLTRVPIGRRGFLRGAAALAPLLAVPGLGRVAFAAGARAQSILIVLHLRGGCDGLNLISPANDPAFVEARATELRVTDDGAQAGHRLSNPAAPSVDFRLHPLASGLAELYDQGHLAFVHAVGLTDTTRSHFVATDLIEHGVSSNAQLARTQEGWLTRAYSRGGGDPLAIAISGLPAGDLVGMNTALAIPGLAGGFEPAGGPAATDLLGLLYGDGGDRAALAGRTALTAFHRVDQGIPRDAAGKVASYQPEHDANYGPAGDFGRSLSTLAQLIKLDLGLAVATLDLGTFDTHEGQAGKFAGLMTRLSTGLAAFWNDVSAYHDRIILVTVTEFGRRLRSNRSGGTDHGRAGVMAVLGGRVAGGRIYGPWPGLNPDALDEGVDLAVATDYRQVLTEILTAQGRPAAAVFPNYASPGPLALVRA